MPQPSLTRRYVLFFAGVILSALGVALITLAGMGTSAVSSLAYVLTFVFPGVSLGSFTFLVNCVMLGGQVMLLGHGFEPVQLLQIPATFVFSFFIDLWMALLSPLVPAAYLGGWVVLLLGCLTMGLGVGVEVLPDVLVLPCEGFVRALCRCRGLEFGRVKTCFDLTMVAAAALVSLLALGSIHGLREGTVMCALTVGGFSRFFSRRLHFLLTPGVE